MAAVDSARSREFGARRDATIMELAHRFHYVQADDIADLVCEGRIGIARTRLLRLHQRGLLRRFALDRLGAFVYTPGKRSQKATHWLQVLRLFRELRRQLPLGWKITAFDPEYDMDTDDRRRLVADALVVLDNPFAKRRRVIFLEVNLDPGFTKTEGYNHLGSGRSYRRTWWWQDGVEISVAVATIRPAYVQRRVIADNPHGILWTVGDVRDPGALWREALLGGRGSPA